MGQHPGTIVERGTSGNTPAITKTFNPIVGVMPPNNTFTVHGIPKYTGSKPASRLPGFHSLQGCWPCRLSAPVPPYYFPPSLLLLHSSRSFSVIFNLTPTAIITESFPYSGYQSILRRWSFLRTSDRLFPGCSPRRFFQGYQT
jgi:hypothetical protein